MTRRQFTASCAAAAWSSLALAAERKRLVDPTSDCGLDYYSQGGVVVDGVAYFTANDDSRLPGVVRTERFPCVVAFDVETFRKIRAYPFTFTYDSSPLVIQRRDGSWLVLAHEWKRQRTKAVQRDSGEVVWISEPNEPGAYFFGYSYYQLDDGSKLILAACRNGLHALSSETGEDVWWLRRRSTGGITPCVDQAGGVIFYQCDGRLIKLRATDGHVLAETKVPPPNRCISWNTVLVDDRYGRYVATRWYGKPEWDSAIRVYDWDLKLLWERTGLPNGKKDTLTYFDGKLVCGSGNGWSKRYTGMAWKYIAAYSIADGREAWRCDLADIDYKAIANWVYFNGYLYGENGGSPPQTTKCFRIDAGTGKLVELYDYGRMITSCATQIIAHGKIFSGDLWQDRIVVTRVATGGRSDWPGPFADPQKHQMNVLDPHAKLTPIREVTSGFISHLRARVRG